MLETLYINHLNKYISKKPKHFYIELLAFIFTAKYLTFEAADTKNFYAYMFADKLRDLCKLLYHYND